MISRGYTVKSYAQTIASRRSIYSISDNLSISDEELSALVAAALEATPSAFNAQAARAVILLGQQHQHFWQLVSAALRDTLSDDEFWEADERVDGFADGYGTILFFEDEAVLAAAAAEAGADASELASWGDQECAIALYNVWNMLEDVGVGASVQHYGALVDAPMRAKWGIAPEWRLVAQMPFGEFDSLPQDKDVVAGASRLRVFK